MAKVTLQNIAKRIGAKGAEATAFREFHLEVADRELLVLLGPSGAGKTTLLRLIAGLAAPEGGELFIGDRRVNGVAPDKRNVALVGGKPALFPSLTVSENLALAGSRGPETKKRVQETAGILGLEPLLERKPATLSLAQSIRVAIGRAMVGQPKVYLFDDPLAGLDAVERTALRAEIARLHERLRVTFLCATRMAEEAWALGSRVALLKDGALLQLDTPARMHTRPASLAAAALAGHPPMNLIHGKLKELPDGVSFKEAGGGVLECKLEGADWRALAGRNVVLGLRPASLAIVAEGAPKNERQFQALVEFVAPMGGHTDVHLHTGAHAIVCTAPGHLAPEDAGHRMRFQIDPAAAQLFDPESGARLG